jgi:RimJ/RimL family protein N-acetyltransferase
VTTVPVELRTERLLLRRWRDDDIDAMTAINQDPVVMATIGPLSTRELTAAFIERTEAGFDHRGFGFWCVEQIGGAPCIGFVGASVPSWTAPFTPCIEVGWRLASAAWGNGYASEAAVATLDDVFARIDVAEIVSFTAAINRKSRRVMEKLGMRRDDDGDFEHPVVPLGDPLRPHVLFRITAGEWWARG